MLAQGISEKEKSTEDLAADRSARMDIFGVSAKY